MENTKTVDASLWWDSFAVLLAELENASLSSDLPQNLLEKVKDNQTWFVNLVSQFKPPNETSKEALKLKKLQIGSHQLDIKPELRDKALQISTLLGLDEVQSYIIAERSVNHSNVVDYVVRDFLHAVLLQYYIERQCLLKCTRQILLHAIYIKNESKEGKSIREEAKKLFLDGLENTSVSVLQDLLSSSYPEQMDVELYTLWAEEILTEDSLLLDIIFLAYDESFCQCNCERWKLFCSLYKGILTCDYNLGKLTITSEALQLSSHAKVQLMLILIETLELKNLLQMLHDEVSFRDGVFPFSTADIQEMDALISTFSAITTKEIGPLFLSWAAFLCLISSLPGKDENPVIMEMDHISYVHQAFDADSLRCCVEILQSDVVKESDGPVTGYRSVLRTLMSAFVASYEINLQQEDSNLELLLDIFCKLYRGEESLCSQFWDKGSFIDGPIRNILCNFAEDFPFRMVEFIKFLSSLAEGSWPAECVYTFLDKSVGITSLFEISNDSMVENNTHIVKTQTPLQVPGFEGLVVPADTYGRILKVIEGNTALVQWKFAPSGVFVLLLRLSQNLYSSNGEEVFVILDLLTRLVSFNTGVCFSLMEIKNTSYLPSSFMDGVTERIAWVAEIICTLIRNLSPTKFNATLMSMGVKILGEMLTCWPSDVTAVALRANIFDISLQIGILSGGINLSSGSWLLSGRLAKMILIDCEHNANEVPLAMSVLDFTMKLLETGLDNEVVVALVVFNLQYVLVNHEYWKYKVKYIRWRITMKVIELVKKCIFSMSYSGKLGEIVRDILYGDSSIHSTLLHIACTTTEALEKLHLSRLCEPVEIEGLHNAISSVLDVLFIMLSKISKDTSPSPSAFPQALLSAATRPVPFAIAVTSLISYSRDPAIQINATKVLAILLTLAEFVKPHIAVNSCFAFEEKQIMDLRHSLSYVLYDQSEVNEDLFVATVNMMTSAALHQASFLIALFASEDSTDGRLSTSDERKEQTIGTPPPLVLKQPNLLTAISYYIEIGDNLIDSKPHLLCSVINFMHALWQGTAQYSHLLDSLKSSGKFWKELSKIIVHKTSELPSFDLNEKEALRVAYKFQCHALILRIMAHEFFLQKRLLDAGMHIKDAGSTDKAEAATQNEKQKVPVSNYLKDIWLSWHSDSNLENLMKLYTSYKVDDMVNSHAKVGLSVFAVLLMERLVTGDCGSLSVSLIQKIRPMLKKLSSQPAFAALLTHYSRHGYSDGNDPNKLVLSDLYYHLQGEFEGRKIDSAPFKELSQFLLQSNLLRTYQIRSNNDLYCTEKDVLLFDLDLVRSDLGLDLWDFSHWRTSREIVETILDRLQLTNSSMLLESSKLAALKSLTTVLIVSNKKIEEKTSSKIPDQLFFSCIDHICQCFHSVIEVLVPTLDASEDVLELLTALTELLLQLTRSVHNSQASHVPLLVLKTASYGLKILRELRPSLTRVNVIMKLLLTLILFVLESDVLHSDLEAGTDMESLEDSDKVSNETLSLLPLLCNCINAAEHDVLSLTILDLIPRRFLTPKTWFSIIQSHLSLQLLILKLQDKHSLALVPIILKFFLTLARVEGGAQILFNSGFLSSLRLLFSESGIPFSRIDDEILSDYSDTTEKPQNIWGLGLAVVTAMVESLGDSTQCACIVDSMISYFFSEKAYLIAYYLNAPNLPSDDFEKKGPRVQRSWTSLAALKETEQTLMLMYELAKHSNSWFKVMREMDTQLREKCIHLLAVISSGSQRWDESCRNSFLLFPPTHKEEIENCRKPSHINSKNGWFALTSLGCCSKPKFSAVSTALVVSGRTFEDLDTVSQTLFSDTVALQIYRIAFLLLKFLCLQAESAAKRAGEVGYIDLAHFPELPMPEILHGLQDQSIAIVTELCEVHKLKIHPEIQELCCFLLQMTEMALSLELCVLQICGIRTVLGRVEDFARASKSLIEASECHAFLKPSIKSLRQIISFIYPGLLQADGCM